ncbi:PDZ domain-containing protein [Aquimarina sp. I32.4]|uniref:PDZ domain-containing protein n=1 Tax=Aquimarina sp. I32.4 TaxID=2053903 RepID=UPI000CDEDD09|nr:PDZ domain-containing protein [Aquimarina sp. I32.4]
MKKTIYFLILIINISFAQNGEYDQLTYKCSDNMDRPFIMYTPKKLDIKKPKPLLVYLHGSISNPNLKKDPLSYIKKSKLIELADKGEFYLLFSYGQKGATWFDSVGIDMVMGEIELAKKDFNINENKVFLSGFSDGGSGALYFSFIKPTEFSGFISMNGSLKVSSKLSNHSLFPANSNHKPLYIINTKDDMLYDIQQITPTIDYLKKYNKNIIYRELEGNHEMSYLKTEQDDIINFIKNTDRKPYDEISWESSDTLNTTINGISIVNIDTLAPRKVWHKPYQLKVFNNKANFGIKYDYSYQEKGLKVSHFVSDSSSAKRMGLKKGDIILMMEKDTITSPYSPYFYVHKKKAGDSTAILIQRNGKTKVIEGRFNNGYFYDIFKNEYSKSKLIATITRNKLSIKTSRVSELKINFNDLAPYNINQLEVNHKKVESKFQDTQIIRIK